MGFYFYKDTTYQSRSGLKKAVPIVANTAAKMVNYKKTSKATKSILVFGETLSCSMMPIYFLQCFTFYRKFYL